VLRNKSTIAMSSVLEELAHTTDHTALLHEAPDYIGSHPIKHAHNFYFILIVSSAFGMWWQIKLPRM